MLLTKQEREQCAYCTHCDKKGLEDHFNWCGVGLMIDDYLDREDSGEIINCRAFSGDAI